jgi:non-heme chloroperoxidase
MRDRRWLKLAILVPIFFTATLFAQDPNGWHDSSPHKVQFVTVDKDVKLEVLDWGGTGPPLVLLSGLGNTAHVFDDFAPKLSSAYHVYGITRRGYGASSAPASGYESDRLADDVLAVLDALDIHRPVLVGHSIAGEELSSIASRHPERVTGLIYLEAAYAQAYAPAGTNTLLFDLPELRKELEQLQAERPPAEQDQRVRKLLQESLPMFEKDLRDLQAWLDATPAQLKSRPQATDADLASFAAFRARLVRMQGFAVPEAELRQQWEARPDGGVGKHRDYSAVAAAITAGERRYSTISVPILAIFANPKPAPYPFNTPAENAAPEALETKGIADIAAAFQKGMPTARVVQIPHADHYVFLTNEADVLREMRAFLKDLQ